MNLNPLFRAGIIDYGHAFNLTMYLKNETEYIVWDRVAASIAYVRDMLSGNAVLYPKFQVGQQKSSFAFLQEHMPIKFYL